MTPDESSPPRPENLDDFQDWLKSAGSPLTPEGRSYYETVTTAARASLEDSATWKRMLDHLQQVDEEYYVRTDYRLLVGSEEGALRLVTKPLESLLLKAFRRNVIENEQWPEPPEGGWITPHNWLTSIKDTLRTFAVVKYLDGVETVVSALESFCAESGLDHESSFEAREHGYYAAHVNMWFDLRVPGTAWEPQILRYPVEMQVTTQVQAVIRRLTHRYYEVRRERTRQLSRAWQWDYSSEEFVANYLGHILHYVEGMIMSIRDQREALR